VWAQAPIERPTGRAQDGQVPRLLLICRHPYHLRREDAQAWLTRELEAVMRRDDLQGARLTRLRNPISQSSSSCEWLVEFRLETGANSRVLMRGAAFSELVADLRLLGMAPMVALADDAGAVELRPS
jgi:hypothetical protein